MKKNSKRKNINLKKLDKQDKALLCTMGVLIVLVIILAIVALCMKNSTSTTKANITIPILEKGTQNEISVDLADMKKGETKEYIFKVSNYKKRGVNEKELDYEIVITPSSNASIELYKGESTKNLIAKDDYEIEGNSLPKDKKTEDEYHMIIKATSTPKKGDKITLKINS